MEVEAMHREGHIGVALLVYSPLGLLVGLIGGLDYAIMGAVASAGLSMAPDIDMRVPLIKHRGITHTVWFAGAAAVVLGLVGFILGLARGILMAIALAPLGFLIGGLSVGSHLVADSLTPAGIRPFEPRSEQYYTLDWFTAANPIANYLLLAVGGAASLLALVIIGRVQ